MSWQKFRVLLLLAPALSIISLLFMGGLLLGLAQSLNYMPLIGQTDPGFAAYRHILTAREFLSSLLLTGWIALASTVGSTGLGLGCALALRRPFRGKRFATVLFQLNLPIPHLVGAVGILLLFSQSGLLARLAYLVGLIGQPADFPALLHDRYAIGIILEYLWKATCFTGIIILAMLQSIGEAYEELARTLGANRWQRFRYVLLPLLWPGLLAASVLVFAYTFGSFEVPYLLGRRYPSALPVLAYRAYTDVDLAARPEAMAMSMIIALLSAILILAYMRLSRLYLR